MADLGMRFVDASTPEADRVFVKIDVPVVTDEVLHQWLCNSLLDDGLWRLARHLLGMAVSRLFSSSLSRRFGFVARNVEPKVARAWCSHCLRVAEPRWGVLCSIRNAVSGSAAPRLEAVSASEAVCAAPAGFAQCPVVVGYKPGACLSECALGAARMP